jgi:hypothetical protein
VKAIRKSLCADLITDALRRVGGWQSARRPRPCDFTEEDRFAIFRRIMHDHVRPIADSLDYAGRTAYSWTFSASAWRSGGRRDFEKRVRRSAQEELAEIDYRVYDFSPLDCIIGDDALHFCELLEASDAVVMAQRMNGMEADLALIDRKLKWFLAKKEPFGEIKYRISLYNHMYEAVIRGKKGGWLWQNLI